jgi:hypothetical protein
MIDVETLQPRRRTMLASGRVIGHGIGTLSKGDVLGSPQGRTSICRRIVERISKTAIVIGPYGVRTVSFFKKTPVKYTFLCWSPCAFPAMRQRNFLLCSMSQPNFSGGAVKRMGGPEDTMGRTVRQQFGPIGQHLFSLSQ